MPGFLAFMDFTKKKKPTVKKPAMKDKLLSLKGQGYFSKKGTKA